ncbi:calcium-activated chloride channel regulator 1-like [Heterodontus francisci]|uniref:calcium-activated chloride channel regulator 1-like n=1 Tax=Heterodontus francisci TaxID=7792 RepID=UPI00355B39EE
MKSTGIFLLSLECLISVYIVRCSAVKLVNNGYENLVIAINPEIPEDPKLITKIQEMVNSASSFLYNATKHRAYYRDVKILLPITWTPNSAYQRPTTQSYEKANVIIADSHVKYGDDPYTLQYGRCGEEGRYIHFTSNFMLNDNLIPVYGTRGTVFVHEWAHLRWGVFDEYNDLVPFYLSGNDIKATRCSKEIKGTIASCTGGSCTPWSNTGFPNTDCMFFPDQKQVTSASIMYLPALPGVVEFCDDNTHNTEAPNMQNKMCNYRSTWDVISKSEDFKNNPPANIASLQPKVTLLQAKDRVLCLVLDTSGSMGMANRINRLKQAAVIFLLQIIEEGSNVGIVTFSNSAHIKALLTVVDSDDVRQRLTNYLPSSASGGTNICAGVRSGFQVLRGDDSATSGDEIVLLTDGEDGGISNCFTEVKQSGAVIHTIALGPSAAAELEQLSVMTGGLQFLATDKLDENGLIDAFTGLVSGNGNMSQQSIQLESSGKSINNNDWFNGTVFVDKTVGNSTFFVITWQQNEPFILVHDPSGKTYDSGDFTIDTTILTARLRIPGKAQTGAWTYTIQNNGNTQIITITVTSRAADENIPPVTVNAHVNQDTSAWPNPLVIYAEVSQGFQPVVLANVKATVERTDGPPVDLVLLDDGSGADAVKNDGIYSRYFTNFRGNGRYSIKVSVQGKDGVTRLTIRKQARAMYIPGYVQNGHIHQNPPKPPIDDDSQTNLGSFNRVKSGGTVIVSQVPTGNLPDRFPPSKIMDLTATIAEDNIQLNWTAPGDDFDQGNASYYEIRMSKNFADLKDNFPNAQSINTKDLKPKVAKSEETFTVSEGIELKNGTVIYFAIRAFDKEKHASELSNIAQAALILPPPVPPTLPRTSQPPSSSAPPAPSSQPSQPDNTLITKITVITLIVGAVVIIVTLIIAITVCVSTNKGRRRVSPS